MRIAIVNSEYAGAGGIGTYTRNISMTLARAGNEVHVLQKQGLPQCHHPLITNHCVERKPDNLRFVRFIGYRFLWNLNLHLEYARGVANLIKRLFNEDKIDIAEIPEFLGEGFFLSGKKQYPYVCRLHTAWPLVRKWNNIKTTLTDRYIDLMERRTAENAVAISSPSAWLLNSFSFTGKAVKPTRIIPYPVDLDIADGKIESSELKVAFVGRLEKRKGIDWFCMIVPDFLKTFHRSTVVIAGEQTKEAESWIQNMKKILIDENLIDRCKIHGGLDHARAKEVIASSHIVVVPSRYDNFPNVVLEAMMESRCIVASRTGGIEEMIEDGKTGILFEPETGERGLREKLWFCAKNENIRYDMGVNARNKAVNEFSPKNVARNTINYYEEVLSNCKT